MLIQSFSKRLNFFLLIAFASMKSIEFEAIFKKVQ